MLVPRSLEEIMKAKQQKSLQEVKEIHNNEGLIVKFDSETKFKTEVEPPKSIEKPRREPALVALAAVKKASTIVVEKKQPSMFLPRSIEVNPEKHIKDYPIVPIHQAFHLTDSLTLVPSFKCVITFSLRREVAADAISNWDIKTQVESLLRRHLDDSKCLLVVTISQRAPTSNISSSSFSRSSTIVSRNCTRLSLCAVEVELDSRALADRVCNLHDTVTSIGDIIVSLAVTFENDERPLLEQAVARGHPDYTLILKRVPRPWFGIDGNSGQVSENTSTSVFVETIFCGVARIARWAYTAVDNKPLTFSQGRNRKNNPMSAHPPASSTVVDDFLRDLGLGDLGVGHDGERPKHGHVGQDIQSLDCNLYLQFADGAEFSRFLACVVSNYY
jgi:hypothetical protein